MNLIFVYNANSGVVNAILDSAHKLLNPSTYNCRLCALTYNTFTENKMWKQFHQTAEVEMKFYHIDEFEKQYGRFNYDFPIVLLDMGSDLLQIITAERFQSINSTEELIELVNEHLQDF